MKPGFLITFEGIDGSGKSTQAEMLHARLDRESYPALLVREPGGTRIAEKIRRLLLDNSHREMDPVTEFLLYAASRAQLTGEKILPALKRGHIVICDRYIDSSLAYQGFGRRVDKSFIQKVNLEATHNLLPDLTFIIDVEVQVANERASNNGPAPDRLEEEGGAFKKRVRNGYRKIAENARDRVILMEGGASIDELHDRVWHITLRKLKQHKYTVVQ